jgi:hypothetical protein
MLLKLKSYGIISQIFASSNETPHSIPLDISAMLAFE